MLNSLNLSCLQRYPSLLLPRALIPLSYCLAEMISKLFIIQAFIIILTSILTSSESVNAAAAIAPARQFFFFRPCCTRRALLTSDLGSVPAIGGLVGRIDHSNVIRGLTWLQRRSGSVCGCDIDAELHTLCLECSGLGCNESTPANQSLCNQFCSTFCGIQQ